MIFARCPACATTFRVRPDQLRAHHGEVRCGHCYAVFNALDHLLEDPPAHPAPPPASPQPPAPPAHEEHPAPEFFLLEELPTESVPETRPLPFETAPPGAEREARESSFDLLADRLEFEIPDSLLPPRTPSPRRQPPPAAQPSAPEPSFREFIDLSDLSPAPSPDRVEPDACTPPSAAGRVPFGEWARRIHSEPTGEPDLGLAEQAAEVAPTQEAPAQDRAPDVPDSREDDPAERRPPPGAVATPDESAEARDDDAREAERLDATYGPPPAERRGLLGLGVGLLLGTLAVQGAYLLRDDITRRWPELRPLYLAACEHIGCTVPLPRDAAAISIETSDLQTEPGQATRFVLNATVRNRATYPQAYPQLELTLTDGSDRPVVRRVLAPTEWVPPERLSGGFPAGQEIVLRLPFEAPGVEAVGYRMYAFYP